MRYLALILLAVSASAQDDSADMKARIRGIRGYARQGAGGIPLIAPYVEDRDAEVRWEAVKALAEIGGETSLDPLVKATRDSESDIQIRSSEGLVNHYLPGYLKTGIGATFRKAGSSLKGRFTDTNTDAIDPSTVVRPDVIEALGKVARGGVSMEARALAARGIGVLRGRAALNDLYEALRTKEDAVLYEALIAIQKIRDPESASRIQFLLGDLRERVQLAAIETTGLLRNRNAIPSLREQLDRSGSAKVRRAALTAIAMMPDEQNRPLYLRYFEDRDDGLRGAAAEGIGRLKAASDVPALEKAFGEEKKMGARLSQAFGLVMAGKTELSEFSPLQYLINTLNSKMYRDSAEPLLNELTRDPAIRKLIYPALPNANKEEKMRLARILGMTGDKETIAVLEPLKVNTDADVAGEVNRAIRNLQARFP